ncbi:MAG TPA: type II toxin-antitoxin system RelE/ParE family toxin [Pyrinomonadaceae bacterium]|nr:type II toxin-antitoxin system RelE/ParE family toxin [Pyrinomonadaceae bacterium]
MPTIKVTAAAEEDLRKIWAYVAEHNREAANKLIKDITGKFALLRDHPHMGRDQSRLLVHLRSFVVRDYFIFYQPFDDGLEILRVLHGSRDIESIFDGFLDSL